MQQNCEKMIETIQKDGKNPLALSEWCSSHHDDLMKLVTENPAEFLTGKLQQCVKPVKQFDPAQQP
jgi:phage host-nuclease inhibitor protein Gam